MEDFIQELKDNGLVEGEWTPEQVSVVLKTFAERFPFENVDAVCRVEGRVTADFLKEKLIDSRRGGLCYEINGLLYVVLKKLGFHVNLGAATIYNDGKWALDRTHAMVLLTLEGKRYVADSGFGNRLALSPLLLDGEAVISPAGTFRLRTRETEKGSIALESQNEQGDWELRYAFDWEAIEWQELTRMKQDIHEHPNSAFNKNMLIARVLPDGTQSISEERIHRKWMNGREETIAFDTKEAMVEAIRQECSPAIAEEAAKYIVNHHKRAAN